MNFLPSSDDVPPCQTWVQLLPDPSDSEVAVLRLVGSVGDKEPRTWHVGDSANIVFGDALRL